MFNKTIYTACISLVCCYGSLTAETDTATETKPTATFEFFDANNDGAVDHKEYKTGIYMVAQQILLDRGAEKKTARAEASKLKKASLAEFQEADTDKSKSLDRAEFEVVHPVTRKEAEPKVTFDFAAADTDQDGFLNAKEYKEAIGKLAQETALANGTEKKESYEILKQAKKDAFAQFKKLDVNKDHMLSADEL